MVFQKGNSYSKGQVPWNKGKTDVYSEESIKKMSDSRIGRTSWNKGITGYKLKPCTEEQKEFLRQLNTGNKYNLGHKHSEETKLKMSESAKGKIKSANHRLNISKSKKGKPSSRKGVVLTEEIKKKISLNSNNKSGKDSPNWKGGRSFEPYCHKFNDKLKELIRNRDNRTCQLCGKLEIDNGRKLDVHHIHYDKPNCNPDLIALCINCNQIVNKNQDYYEELFMNKLYNLHNPIV